MPSIMKMVLPALAVAGTAQAACSVSATTTVQNSGDAAAMTSCATFSGSIAIATGTTDDIAFSGIKQLEGNLVAPPNSNIKRISANDLVNITGEMNLDGLTRLNGVDFPQLKNVSSIKWNALPALQNIGFTSSVETAKKIDIQNTAVRSLKGINIVQAEILNIANNQYINEISMQLGNVSKSLDFSFNNKAVKVELPNLIWANNLTFRFCGSVSLPSLTKLNASLGLYNNDFESFAAPNLTEVGALAVVANEKMSNMSFPLLTKVSANLQIANNTELGEVDGLPKLKSVKGAVNITGAITEVDTPELDSVGGVFNLLSTENITCSFFDNLSKKKLIEGKYKCEGKLANGDGAGVNPQSGKPSSNNKSGASSLSAVNGALGLAAMAAVFLL